VDNGEVNGEVNEFSRRNSEVRPALRANMRICVFLSYEGRGSMGYLPSLGQTMGGAGTGVCTFYHHCCSDIEGL
jgi:hypothetical protein